MSLLANQPFPLWEGRAPFATGTGSEDIPTLEAWLPPPGLASGGAIIVCPGGGYGMLADHEGPPVAQWLAEMGITALVLRYRVGDRYHFPASFLDVHRAVRLVRAHAAEWGLDSARIGILGFSAGGHLASVAATHGRAGYAEAQDAIDRVSARPDLHILIYPVISFTTQVHEGSRHRLLDEPTTTSPELIWFLSSEQQVTPQTPPGFVVHSTNDAGVPVSNADGYVAALHTAGVACRYIRSDPSSEEDADRYAHGHGLQPFWTEPCRAWLAEQGFLRQ